MSLNKRQKDMKEGAMAHNDLISEGVPTLTDAYQQGRDDEHAALLPILADLLAELRAVHRPSADLDGELRLCTEGCGVIPCLSLTYADRAEARLKGMSE